MFSTLRFHYKSKAFINLLSHMNYDAPDVLMLTLRCTKHPQGTENPLMYLTDIIRGEIIQILILKPNANEQVILSSLTFVTGLPKACLF